MEKYDHEYSFELYLIENSNSFRDCIEKNPSIVQKIPEILTIIHQEVYVLEKILYMYQKLNFEFKIFKNQKYANNYLEYIIKGELNELLIKNYLMVSKEEFQDYYLFRTNLDMNIPKEFQDIVLSNIESEINRHVKILLNLNKIHEEF
ncbi:hypothetical protein Mevan_1598 [Methanococcus vannielii SB]|uniref:Uncharacterized protein n=1 Tax=Methanococcus vannielii (strain ATCC 35089 / DSM 1224 / JCM 13029 / OCM 148 / SB) TaxID=406327 RepID=A6USL8_METVS|nr:hypothetical protein [Methanococcus vannielii]ABR55490.1 hypothetical protein Mevan_1598 [Methanococcus vannielii SB]